MIRVHYLCRFRLDGSEKFLIWFLDEPDGVLVDNGKLPTFADADKARRYARLRGISLEAGEPGVFDLDYLARWLREPAGDIIDCNAFFDLWNLFGDVSTSLGGDFDPVPPRTQGVYEKLFRGCNLPSVTPPGEPFRPIWSASELRLLRETLGQGLDLFRRAASAPPR